MKNVLGKVTKLLLAAGVTIGIIFGGTVSVYADEAADAQAAQALQLQLLMQTPEYQAALAAQQAQQAQYQAALAAQQKALEQYQAAALAQYQAALQQQYAAALLAWNNAQYLRQASVNQTYLLNSIQSLQKAQYESMINKGNLDYKSMLMENFTKEQQAAMKAFMGYNGL